MEQKTIIDGCLWLFACERFCCLIEILDNGIKFRVAILYNDSSIESLSLNYGIGSSHRETLRSGKFFKPSDKQTVALCFATIASITDIQQYIFVFDEKLFYDSNKRIFHMGIIPRMGIFTFAKAKLISVTTTKRYIFQKTDTISCARISGKIKVAIIENNLVWRLPIDIFKSNFYHTTAIACWSSLAQRSATLRSHSRLISNECFHRRKASSCVIFFISIMVLHFISCCKVKHIFRIKQIF